MGKHAFVGLHDGWPLLCVSRVLEEFRTAGIRGFEPWPVLLHRTGEPSQVLQQAYVTSTASAPTLAEEAAETQRFRKELCRVCGHARYIRYTRGMMPVRRSALRGDVDLQLTHEWFGSGHAAHQEILVSGRVARLVVERAWGGILLWPVQLL